MMTGPTNVHIAGMKGSALIQQLKEKNKLVCLVPVLAKFTTMVIVTHLQIRMCIGMMQYSY